MSDRYSQLLANYAANVQNVPENSRHEAKRRLLDTLGVMYAASGEETVAKFAGYAKQFRFDNGARVLGLPHRVAPEIAAFVNGMMARYLDYNDTYLSLEPLHPSDMIPGLLALAEWRQVDGRSLLDAIAVAYEVSVTLCDAASLRKHGWDHVNYIGIGTACGASRLLHLSAEQTEHAISIAALPHASARQTRAGELSNWKGAAAANSVRNGVFATLLAEQGVTGPFQPFEGEMAFFKQLLNGERFDDTVLEPLEALQPPTRILDTYIKLYPVEYHAQSAVDIALDLRNELGAEGLKHIEHIAIDTFRVAYEIIAKDPEKWRPTTRETADHSLPYITAVALLDGTVTQRSFDSDRLSHPMIREWLGERMSLEEKAELSAGYPEGIPNRIAIRTSDGKCIERTVAYPRGHAKNPMTDDEVTAKFRQNVEGRLQPEEAEALIAAVLQFDTRTDMGAFTDLWKGVNH